MSSVNIPAAEDVDEARNRLNATEKLAMEPAFGFICRALRGRWEPRRPKGKADRMQGRPLASC
jgi:hypothetical protein